MKKVCFFMYSMRNFVWLPPCLHYITTVIKSTLKERFSLEIHQMSNGFLRRVCTLGRIDVTCITASHLLLRAGDD